MAELFKERPDDGSVAAGLINAVRRTTVGRRLDCAWEGFADLARRTPPGQFMECIDEIVQKNVRVPTYHRKVAPGQSRLEGLRASKGFLAQTVANAACVISIPCMVGARLGTVEEDARIILEETIHPRPLTAEQRAANERYLESLRRRDDGKPRDAWGRTAEEAQAEYNRMERERYDRELTLFHMRHRPGQ
jgi:hypothetical protein